MELAQLEFFIRVVEERSFSKAADRVFRTQPAVSIAIRRLEHEIGAPLFDRAQKKPTLTDTGQVLYDYALRMLALRDQARDAVSQLRELRTGRVRVGANESTSLPGPVTSSSIPAPRTSGMTSRTGSEAGRCG